MNDTTFQDVTEAAPSVSLIHVAGVIALLVGIISAIGVVLLILMYATLSTPLKLFGITAGTLNDICVALQYLLSIPIALALYPILQPHNPTMIRIATIAGIVFMMITTILQLLLIFRVLAFEQQVLWVSLSMIVGVGFWLVVTGLSARDTGRLPNSLLLSSLAVPYIGYPAWAIWLGLHLIKW